MLNLAARGKQNVEKDSMLSNSFDVKLQLAKKLTVVRLPSIILAFTVKSKLSNNHRKILSFLKFKKYVFFSKLYLFIACWSK